MEGFYPLWLISFLFGGFCLLVSLSNLLRSHNDKARARAKAAKAEEAAEYRRSVDNIVVLQEREFASPALALNSPSTEAPNLAIAASKRPFQQWVESSHAASIVAPDGLDALQELAVNEVWFQRILSMAILALETGYTKWSQLSREHIETAAADIYLLHEADPYAGPLLIKVNNGVHLLSRRELEEALQREFVVPREDSDRPVTNPVFKRH